MSLVSLIAYIISVAIPAFAVYLIFALDLFGTGKGNTVAICLAWGAVGAFGLSYFINTMMIDYFESRPDLAQSLAWFLETDNLASRDLAFRMVSTRTAPVVEELAKALILFYFILQPRFRYFVDGAIYGFAAGIGFAMTENIFYVSRETDAALVLAISRVLSASLMHATSGALIGIALGLGRRVNPPQRYAVPFAGMFFSILGHFIYNNSLFLLEGKGIALLIVAIGIGMGGGLAIGAFINNGLDQEKKRFSETLSVSAGISRGERKAVQNLGSEAIDKILEEMAQMFGEDNAKLIQELLVIQANMGILKNNLKSPVSDRLKQAWEKDIQDLRDKMDSIRSQLGTYIMTLLRSLLDDDSTNWDEFNSAMTQFDPGHVHSFDLFITASRVSNAMKPEQLEAIANRIKRISIFANVDIADLDNLSRAINLRSFSHGEILFRQDDSGDAMYMIDRGYIDIFLGDEDGSETLLRTFQAGDVVGELALLDGQPRTATARANGPLRVMILQRQHFMMFIQSRPNVILSVLQFLSEKVRYTTHAVTDSAQNITVQELEELTDLMDTDGIIAIDEEVTQSLKKKGVFGRISAALDDIESDGKGPRRNTSPIVDRFD